MRIYMGTKMTSDKYGKTNKGDIWVQQPDDTYICDKYPGRKLNHLQISQDVHNGYLTDYTPKHPGEGALVLVKKPISWLRRLFQIVRK